MTDKWQFQDQAVNLTLAALEEYRRALLQGPTGMGKTRCAIRLATALPKPLLFMAEGKEIVRQSLAAFREQGLEVDALTADSRTGNLMLPSLSADIVIGSQRTVWSRGVRKGHVLPQFQTILIDEAHHVRARTYEEILELWPKAKIVLLTATPVRGDGKGLGNVADVMVQADDFNGNYSHLTKRGVLVPCPPDLVWSWPKDMRGIKKQAGDYVMGGENGHAKALNTPRLIGDIVQHHKKLAGNRPTIVYASSVAHAENLADAFEQAGTPAACVHAQTDKEEREATLSALEAGIIQVVTNFGVLTEGFDCPPVSCIVLARRTALVGLYVQMVGRGLRSAPGKKDLMVQDHVGNVPEHGLPGTDIHWHLTTDDFAARNDTKKRVVPCPQCGRILQSNGTCGGCGYSIRREKPASPAAPSGHIYDASDEDPAVNLVRLTDSAAAQVTADRSDPRRSEYMRLKRVAIRKGIKPGWVAYKYKEQFGEWPNRTWDLPNPIKCTPAEFLSAAKKMAQDRGWKPGWAAFKFKEVYGTFPPRDRS